MKRLIVALLVSGILFGTIWVLAGALPLTDPTAGSGSNSFSNGGDPWTSGPSFSLMGSP